MKIYSLEETVIGRFGMDLKKLMEKHGIESITPMFWEMKIGLTKDGKFTMTGCSIKTQDGVEDESTLLTVDEYLDKYNDLLATHEITGDDDYLVKAEELMNFIKTKFWNV